MNVVLFGAGASFGQAGPEKPPLTGGLYGELKERFTESWGKLPAGLEKLFADPWQFEAGTTKLIRDAWGDGENIKSNFQEESETIKRWCILQWDLAEFFFEFTPIPGNLYERFFGAFSVPELLSLRIATLNYDRLLQLAVSSRGIGVCYSGAPNLAEPLALCLPHGACSLVAAVRAVSTKEGLSLQGSGEITPSGGMLALDGPILELKNLEDLKARRKDFFPPVMSYVEPSKAPPSGQSFLQKQQEVWCSWLQQATRVALVGVGVRNRETPDAHLWEPLRITKAQILYVSPDGADRFKEWAAGCGRQGDVTIPNTWNDALNDVTAFLRPQRRTERL